MPLGGPRVRIVLPLCPRHQETRQLGRVKTLGPTDDAGTPAAQRPRQAGASARAWQEGQSVSSRKGVARIAVAAR